MYSYKILQTNPNTLLLARCKDKSIEGKAIIFGSESNISDLRTIDISENNQASSSAFKVFGYIADGGNFDEKLVSEVEEENKKDTVKEALNFINEGGFIKPGFTTSVGLTDSFIFSYSGIHIGNQIIPYILNKTETNSNNDIMLRYNRHYSSLPLIGKQRYLFDSAGNLHQNLDKDQSFKVKSEIVSKFPGIQSLNPFGLDYQNNSNACGIWSANILNQVQKFKKSGKENEIVKTYKYSNNKDYQILNPEILLKATAQVSKDLTPEGEKPEIKILQTGEQIEEGYTPLKIGDTTFAIDTTYRTDRCIDIEAIALSIPRKELSKEINQDFIKEQEKIIAKTFSPIIDSLTQKQKEGEQKRRKKLKLICNASFSKRELIDIISQSLNIKQTLSNSKSSASSLPVLKCLNFNVAQNLAKQETTKPQSTPPKSQPKLPSF